MSDSKFWEEKTLNEMSDSEWESLCDRCGKCCLVKLEDEDNGDVLCTNIACQQFDLNNGQCKSYDNRAEVVPTCMVLTKDNIESSMRFAPSTCAYRLIHEGKPLEKWHHLKSGSYNTVHEQGVSVVGKVVSVDDVDEADYEDHIANANTLKVLSE